MGVSGARWGLTCRSRTLGRGRRNSCEPPASRGAARATLTGWQALLSVSVFPSAEGTLTCSPASHPPRPPRRPGSCRSCSHALASRDPGAGLAQMQGAGWRAGGPAPSASHGTGRSPGSGAPLVTQASWKDTEAGGCRGLPMGGWGGPPPLRGPRSGLRLPGHSARPLVLGPGPLLTPSLVRLCQSKHSLLHLPAGQLPSVLWASLLSGRCPGAHLLGIAIWSSGGAREEPEVLHNDPLSPPHGPGLPGLSGGPWARPVLPEPQCSHL